MRFFKKNKVVKHDVIFINHRTNEYTHEILTAEEISNVLHTIPTMDVVEDSIIH